MQANNAVHSQQPSGHPLQSPSSQQTLPGYQTPGTVNMNIDQTHKKSANGQPCQFPQQYVPSSQSLHYQGYLSAASPGSPPQQQSSFRYEPAPHTVPSTGLPAPYLDSLQLPLGTAQALNLMIDHQNILKKGTVSSWIQWPVQTLKPYFQVSHEYVFKKLSIILFPFIHKV